jgi:hypothetical protein
LFATACKIALNSGLVAAISVRAFTVIAFEEVVVAGVDAGTGAAGVVGAGAGVGGAALTGF